MTLTEPLSVDEVNEFLNSCHRRSHNNLGQTETAVLARRAALCEIIYASGLTLSEALGLGPADFDRRRLALDIRGSDGVIDRTAPTLATAIAAVDFWRERSHACGGMSDEWIFHGIGDPSSPLTRQAASRDFKTAAIDAGVKNPGRYNAKLIRMSLIQHLHDNGLSQHLIGQALGIHDITKVARELDLSTMPGWDAAWASLNLVIDQ